MNTSHLISVTPQRSWSAPRLIRLGTIADVANNGTGTVQNSQKGS